MPNFKVLESVFSDFLTAAKVELSESERSEVKSFVDVREYGLALETIVDIYVEESKKPSAEVVTYIVKLAEFMAMEPERILKKLSKLP